MRRVKEALRERGEGDEGGGDTPVSVPVGEEREGERREEGGWLGVDPDPGGGADAPVEEELRREAASGGENEVTAGGGEAGGEDGARVDVRVGAREARCANVIGEVGMGEMGVVVLVAAALEVEVALDVAVGVVVATFVLEAKARCVRVRVWDREIGRPGGRGGCVGFGEVPEVMCRRGIGLDIDDLTG